MSVHGRSRPVSEAQTIASQLFSILMIWLLFKLLPAPAAKTLIDRQYNSGGSDRFERSVDCLLPVWAIYMGFAAIFEDVAGFRLPDTKIPPSTRPIHKLDRVAAAQNMPVPPRIG